MAFSTLIIIITTMLLMGGLLGYFLQPSLRWCIDIFRRFYFRPKLMVEHKVTWQKPAPESNLKDEQQ